MYKLIFLDIAKKDIEDILFYISNVLNNKSAAKNIIKKFIKEYNNILLFPYSNPEVETIKYTEYNYRKCNVKNYSILYTIDEKNKEIIISRIVYNKRNFEKVLL